LTAAERFRQTMRKGGKRYLEISSVSQETGEVQELQPHISIDHERIRFDEQFDGINVLITSYHSLSRIEDCFRTMKTTFEARPVYLSTPPHIQAHFLICFIALTLMRVLEHETKQKLSPNRIKVALKSAKCRELERGYWEVFGNEDLKILHRHLNIEWNNKYVTIEKLRRYGR